MSSEAIRKKTFLFVDDDTSLLATLRELFEQMSGGSWDIATAHNHSDALALMRDKKVDVVVLDIGMPVMDGVQFLRLIMRTYPGQQVVMLTGLATDEKHKVCTDLGAALFLEKPTTATGYREVFSAIDALASALPQEGFRGVMRQVGLQDVLQMECLGAKSSVLEVFTGKARGRIYIHDGSIVHAETGKLQGELALYSLLALRGGGFNLLQFVEPSQRSIHGQWEFLLMEAARLKDEGGLPETAEASPEISTAQAAELVAETAAPVAAPGSSTEEIVLCSGAGEVLYEWQCASAPARVELFQFIEQCAEALSKKATVGRFDRIELTTAEGRTVCQIQPDRRLLVRTKSGGHA